MNPEDVRITVELVTAVLRLLREARGLLQGAGKVVRKARLERYATPRALQRALVRGEVEVGQTVKIEGYLSRYAHLYRPVSFVNVRLDAERMASTKARVERGGTFRGMQLPRGAKIASMSDVLVAQNAIASLPPFDIGDTRSRCLFLYPGSHDRFLYSTREDSHSLRLPDYLNPRIDIPQDAWPIPLLAPAEDALQLAEKRVRAVATLRELPPDLSQRFGDLYVNHYDQRVLSNFLMLPSEPRLSICLSMLPDDEDTGADVEKSSSSADRSLLYVEGHVEGVSGPDDVNTIARSVPLDGRIGSLSQQSFAHGVVQVGPAGDAAIEGELFRMLAAPDDISVIIKLPNVVGFYAETGPTRGLVTRSEELQALVSLFRANLTAASQEAGAELSFSTDFLFDFERQQSFETGGVLSSETALQALRDDDLDGTRHWLRGEADG